MPVSNEADDATLIEGVLSGRRQDFDELVRRHQRALFAFVLRFTRDQDQAADVVQSTFVLAYTRLSQFQSRSSFKTWLHQIALNECRSAYRKKRDKREEVALEEVPEAQLGDFDESIKRETGLAWRTLFERLIDRLPTRQKSVLTLRVFSDLSFGDIARVEGISENSAKVNFHHAITRLKSWLKEEK